MTSEPIEQRDEIEQRATAFVFGELDGDSATQFMKEMEASPELRSIVASIREAVGALQEEFAGGTPGVSEADRRRIEIAMRDPEPAAPPVARLDADSSTRRWVIGLAVAATFLLACGLTLPALNKVITANTDTERLRDRIRQIESENERLIAQKQLIERKLADAQPITANTSDAKAEPKVADELRLAKNPAEDTNRESGAPGSTPANSTTQPALSSSLALEMSGSADNGEKSNAQPGDRSQSTSSLETLDVREGLTTQSGADAVPMEGDKFSTKVDAELAALGFEDVSVAQDQRGSQQSSGSAKASAMAENSPGRGGNLENSEGGMMMDMDMDMEMRMDMADAMGNSGEAEEFMMMGGMRGGVGGGGMGGGAMQGGERQERRSRDFRKLDGNGDQPRSFGLAFQSGDRFAPIHDNSFRSVGKSPLSTFSIDVDTAAYAKVRMYLMQHNRFPSPDAVRIEELVNYFDYDYAPPKDGRPFAAAMDIAGCPWNPKHRLARIGIKGKVIDEQRPPSNLVFLLDVSGSMNQPNKLPLVVDGMKMLVNQLGENDSVAIVVYAGAAGMVLDSTTGDRKKIIIDSLDRLRAGGSTNGGQGIQLAYSIARDNFIVGGTNRVILCSDGDFNVGVTGTDQLVSIAAENAKGNIFLSVLGFGTGNHNDSMMEQISNKGNGNYAFIDTEDEARKVLVEQMQGTLVTIAKDVKIQVEFNPMEVASYRLIGYENRVLAAKDFNDDTKDAGEIGAGHTVTALYEIVPTRAVEAADEGDGRKQIDDLKYQRQIRYSEHAESGEMLTLKLRYKQPTGDRSTLIEFPVKDSGKRFNGTDRDFQFAASVAAFGMMLRNSPHKGSTNFDMIEELVLVGAQDDRSGYRDEFASLVKRARQLAGK